MSWSVGDAASGAGRPTRGYPPGPRSSFPLRWHSRNLPKLSVLPGCPSVTARTAPRRCPCHGWLLRGGWGGETRAGRAEASGRGPEGNNLCPTARPGGWRKTLPLDGFLGKVFACLNATKFFGLRLRHCNELTSRELCSQNWRQLAAVGRDALQLPGSVLRTLQQCPLVLPPAKCEPVSDLFLVGKFSPGEKKKMSLCMCV